jgi:hypothetical protein
MTPATATSTVWTNWHWPEDIRQFAAQHDAESYLEPLKQALARLFPTATKAKVILELDPELRDERAIVFDVSVPEVDIPDYVAACWNWHAEALRVCPAVKAWIFRLVLIPV